MDHSKDAHQVWIQPMSWRGRASTSQQHCLKNSLTWGDLQICLCIQKSIHIEWWIIFACVTKARALPTASPTSKSTSDTSRSSWCSSTSPSYPSRSWLISLRSRSSMWPLWTACFTILIRACTKVGAKPLMKWLVARCTACSMHLMWECMSQWH